MVYLRTPPVMPDMTGLEPLRSINIMEFLCSDGALPRMYVHVFVTIFAKYKYIENHCFLQISLFIFCADLSIKRWPLRGTVNHLSYKNVFCAVCNGVDVATPLDLTANVSGIIYNGADPPSDLTPVAWWTAKVFCSQYYIDRYLNNTPSHGQLILMIRE